MKGGDDKVTSLDHNESWQMTASLKQW